MMLRRFSALSMVFVSAMASLVFLVPAPAAKAIDCSSKSLLGVPTWYKYLEVKEFQPTKKSGSESAAENNQARVPDPDRDPICQVVGPCVNKDTGEPVSTCDGTTTRLNIALVTQRVAIAILDILLRIAGIVAFVFIVVAGFKFVLSEGDSNKAKDARNTALNAAIGLGIAIVATGIVSFIGRSISN